MSTFWCFSFEGLNGVLGDQPTNNRSMGIQFLQNENSHYQMLHTMPTVRDGSDLNVVFSQVVTHHVYGFYTIFTIKPHQNSQFVWNQDCSASYPKSIQYQCFMKNSTKFVCTFTRRYTLVKQLLLLERRT